MPTGVSRETEARLDRFASELARWNQKINLIGPATADEIRARHVADSLQLLPLRPPGTRHWVDLGTGGGFPGLVVAIAAADEAPEIAFTLVESDARKAAFLARAADAAGVTPDIRVARAEALPPLAGDVVSARALAPLPRLLGLVHRHLAPHGTALLPKGRRWREEVDEALASWSFAVQNIPSQTDPAGAVLAIQGVTRA
jgi:16S rRNA (guanine527-N7)-methyltransferase